jgi:uncharacterized protein YcfJ
MAIRRNRCAGGIAALVLLGASITSACAARTSATAAGAAPPVGDWERVARVPVGTALKVEDRSGTVTEGWFASTEADRVTLQRRTGHVAIPRTDVKRITAPHRQTASGAKRGFKIGAVAGGLVGGLATRSNRPAWAAFLALGWGAIGALIGAVDGAQNVDDVVIYDGAGQPGS